MDPPADHRRGIDFVRVGVGVIVMNEKKQLYAGIRRNSHGSGKLALPGGHLEMYETWEECVIREVYEEMNVQIVSEDDDDNNNNLPNTIQYVHAFNNIMKDDGKHYVTIIMMVTVPIQSIPINMEPTKCDGWVPYSWNELVDRSTKDPDSFFSPFLQLLQTKPPKLIELLGL